MADFSRQVIGFDVTSLISLFWILFYFLVFYWFYSILKRMEKTPSGNQETIRKQDVNQKKGNTDKLVILKLGKSGNSYFICEILVHGS
jgi:hypothetical protein